MLDALPLQENILTNQLIVNTTNTQLQPMTIQYVDDFDDTRTQDVCTLNLNGARVLSSYTNATPITTNGTHEFDVVDSNVNMPIMNYQVNVNVPQPAVYDAPAVYTTKRIISNGNYVLGDFVNDNITNYTYLHKSIPVIIDIDTTLYMFYMKYNGVEFNRQNMTLKTSGSITLDPQKTIIVFHEFSSFADINMIENATTSSKSVTVGNGSYYKIIDYNGNAGYDRLYLENAMFETIMILNDVTATDTTGNIVTIYP